MRGKVGSLVRRKIGGVVGVIMASNPGEKGRTGIFCEVAFGYLTKTDAQINKTSTTKWPMIHSNLLEFINS